MLKPYLASLTVLLLESSAQASVCTNTESGRRASFDIAGSSELDLGDDELGAGEGPIEPG